MSAIRTMISHLRSPQSGLLGQVLRFGLVGGSVAVLYLTVTTVLYKVVGLDFQIALAIGFVSGLTLHFTLQRVFVWIHHEGFALELHHQLGRYLAMAATQYAVTAASTAWLPGALKIPTETAYLLTMTVVTLAGFLLMRFIIFHAHPELQQEDSSVMLMPGAPRPSATGSPHHQERSKL
jgi:putative flippase GtrA